MLYPVTKKHTASTCFQEVETAEYLMLGKNLWSLRIEEGGMASFKGDLWSEVITV